MSWGMRKHVRFRTGQLDLGTPGRVSRAILCSRGCPVPGGTQPAFTKPIPAAPPPVVTAHKSIPSWEPLLYGAEAGSKVINADRRAEGDV